MANYQLLKADIDTKVYQNGHQEITGENLNSVLNAMVTTLGAEYQFAGVATIDTNPGTPDAKVFYIANGKGTYTNFGGINVTEDEVVVLYWDSSWHKVSTGIASQEKVTELGDVTGAISKSYIYDNILNGIQTNDNKAVNPGNGVLFIADGWRATDYIPITGGDTLYSNDIDLIAFYDGNKEFVSGMDTLPFKFVVAENVHYVRVSINDGASNPYIGHININEFITPIEGYIDQDRIFNKNRYVEGNETPNLLREGRYVDNSYIDFNTGAINNAKNYKATNHIVLEGSILYASHCDQGAFYDSQKKYISGFVGIGSNGIEIPTNAVSVRITIPPYEWERAYLGFTKPSGDFTYPKHNYISGNDVEPKKVVYVGNGGDYTSILSALRHTESSTKIFVGYGTYNIVQEYINEYSGYFWRDYNGYSGVEDDFYKGLWIGNGRVIEFSPLANVVWDYDGANTAVNTYFSPFSLEENATIIGLKLSFNNNCRYAIHDDFAVKEGTNLIKDCIFTAVNRSGGTTIGGGCNGYNTYKIENCVFIGDSENDISYHNSSSIGQNRIYVTDCMGSNKCYFGRYGQSTSESPTYCIVSNSYFRSIVVQAHTPGANDNMVLINFNNTTNE